MELLIKPAKSLQGEITVPGDKSISHRAVMFGALADGITEVENFLMGQDCLSTMRCFQALGIDTEVRDGIISIKGRGLDGLQEPGDILDVGNSGTTIRLMMGITAGQKFFTAFTGDASIRKRPMGRVAKPLRQMGAQIWGRNNGDLAPLAINGTELQGIHYDSPVASAQVKSAVLLAGLFAQGNTSISEPAKSRDHTERMLKYFGARIEVAGNKITVSPKPSLKAQIVKVPGDISSAAFFIVAGLIVPNSEILIRNVGVNPTRDGIIEVLRNMGGQITLENKCECSGEPVADIRVKTSSLKGTEIRGSMIPRLIDEIPAIAVAAALAEGETVISDAAELKVKETNRITTVIEEMGRLGVKIEELPDGMRIPGEQLLQGARCKSHHDHRIAMAMAVAGLAARGETVIEDSECIDISFPGFGTLLDKIRS